jgi:hypothetical protein
LPASGVRLPLPAACCLLSVAACRCCRQAGVVGVVGGGRLDDTLSQKQCFFGVFRQKFVLLCTTIKERTYDKSDTWQKKLL